MDDETLSSCRFETIKKPDLSAWLDGIKGRRASNP